MRFTTSKETRNPNTYIICGCIYTGCIIIKKFSKVFRQFSCNNVLLQLLFFILCFYLPNLDNARYRTVNVF